MTGLAQMERQALCSTLISVGPEAPTLCDGWTARELGAHLVVRERRPDAAVGIVVPPLSDRTQRVTEEYTNLEWTRLVDMVRQGPPGWSPSRLPSVDDAINLAEFFVHHEDVLRAGEWQPADARPLTDTVQTAMWSRLKHAGQLLFRRSPVGVVLVSDGHGQKSVHGPTALGTVTITGVPSELVLYAFGRRAVAQVQLEGEDDALEALTDASFDI